MAGFRVAKRRDDWLLGRVGAKAVVAAALEEWVPGPWPLQAIEIASEASGMPYARIAPEAGEVGGFAPGERLPISVSISHAEGRALCAATWSEAGGDGPRRRGGDGGARPMLAGRGSRPMGGDGGTGPMLGDGGSRPMVGVDLGAVEPRSPGFVRTFLTDEEQRFVAGAPPGEAELRANLVWCGKEAVLKALGLGLTVDTMEVSCLPGRRLADAAGWPLAPADGGWRPFLARCGPAVVAGGGTIRGIWRLFGGFVAALAVHAERAMEEPRAAPLAAAGAGHGPGGSAAVGGGRSSGRRAAGADPA